MVCVFRQEILPDSRAHAIEHSVQPPIVEEDGEEEWASSGSVNGALLGSTALDGGLDRRQWKLKL